MQQQRVVNTHSFLSQIRNVVLTYMVLSMPDRKIENPQAQDNNLCKADTNPATESGHG